MKTPAESLRLACAAVLVLVVGLAGTSPARAEITYSGRAFAAYVNVPTLGVGPLYISDTGELPSTGGSLSAAFLSTQVLNVLSAEVLVASTSGANNSANSSASLANVVVLPGHPAQVTASFVRAETAATCGGVQGSTEVAELTFGGMTIEVPPGGFPPNTRVELPGVATLTINEQTMSSSGHFQEITVNALRLKLATGDEVILSSAHSDINCVPPPPPVCHDFVTGGGWITPGGKQANFGFNAGFKPNAPTPTVHFNYIDHNTSMKVKATSITAYVQGGSATARHFEGSAEIDGISGYTYSIDVADNGEPGRHRDTVSVSLSNGYSAGGTLDGGNLQLHKPCD